MKLEQPDCVCVDDLPASPESVNDNSPSMSPALSPQSPDPYKDEHMYLAPYSPAPSQYSYPPSPSYSDDPCYHAYPYTDYPTAVSDAESLAGQREFLSAVVAGNYKEIKRILTHYSPKIQLNAFTPDGQTALTQSCLSGNLAIVQLLISYGASVHLTNRDGFSPLHVACWCGKMDVMQYILRIASTR